jgi:hypothetical protein
MPEELRDRIPMIPFPLPSHCSQFNSNNTNSLYSLQLENRSIVSNPAQTASIHCSQSNSNKISLLPTTRRMAAKAPTSQSLFTFDPSDVRLKVKYKGESITAHVSSSAMSFASPVWKKFVFQPWKPVAAKNRSTDSDSTPDAKKCKVADQDDRDKTKSGLPVEELDFTGDNGEALLILLRIAHLRFQDNPSTLPYQTLL